MTQTIDHDTDRWNPRDEDNLGNMWFHHGRYQLGDPIQMSVEEVLEFLHTNRNDIFFEPVYMMDHRSLSFQMMPYTGMYGYFDSGQIGFIWAWKSDARDWFGQNESEPRLKEDVKQRFVTELAAYQRYVNGYGDE
jgi:hypothetical protein